MCKKSIKSTRDAKVVRNQRLKDGLYDLKSKGNTNAILFIHKDDFKIDNSIITIDTGVSKYHLSCNDVILSGTRDVEVFELTINIDKFLLAIETEEINIYK